MVLHAKFDPVDTPGQMARYGATILGSATPFFVAYIAAQEAHGDEPLRGPVAVRPARALRGTTRRTRHIQRLRTDRVSGHRVSRARRPDDLVDACAFRPGPGIAVRIIDAGDRRLRVGEQGELVVKGPQSFVGYLDDSPTARASYGDGFMRTGDLAGLLADGHVRIVGRLEDIIIRNGENISAAEVESALVDIPKIADVAVIGLPDATSREQVCAVVVAKDPHDPPLLAELVGARRHAGPARFNHVEHIELVGKLPRSPMGKLGKHDILRDIVARRSWAAEGGR